MRSKALMASRMTKPLRRSTNANGSAVQPLASDALARLTGLEEPAVVLLRTLEPLKVPSPDKTGAQLFIVILAPEDGADDHLELLRETAELFSDAEARETLLKASTPVEVCEFLTHWETAQTAAAQ